MTSLRIDETAGFPDGIAYPIMNWSGKRSTVRATSLRALTEQAMVARRPRQQPCVLAPFGEEAEEAVAAYRFPDHRRAPGGRLITSAASIAVAGGSPALVSRMARGSARGSTSCCDFSLITKGVCCRWGER